jgi:hypothetical protein
MLAPVEVVTGGEEEELVHQELQQEVQQRQQQHVAATEDLEITMQVEPPGSPVSSAQADVSQPGGMDGNAAATAAAAVSPPYNSRGKDLCLYSPGGGLRPKSEMLHIPQMTPGGKHQNFCWVAGDLVGSSQQRQQQPVLPAATFMQQLLHGCNEKISCSRGNCSSSSRWHWSMSSLSCSSSSNSNSRLLA